MSRFDVAVVGGGHNGLVCACYLAQAGKSVCVLERDTRLGGAAITEEFHPGFRNSVASYTVSLLQAKIIDELNLHAHGLKILPRPLHNFIPSLHGPGLKLPSQTVSRQAAIATHSQADADRYPEFLAELGAVADLLRTQLLEAPLNPSGGWRELWRVAQQLFRFRYSSARELASGWELMTGSAGHWLDRHFDNDLLKGGLGFDSIVGHFASPYHPGSAYLLLHHALGEVNGQTGCWGHAVGGMGAISDALAAEARSRGVDIRVAHAVDRIDRDKYGFEVHAAGGVVRSSAVAAAIHPQTLFTQLLDAGELPQSFLKRMQHWRSESASFRLNLALSELPDFDCLPGRDRAEHHTAGIIVAPGLAYLDEAYVDAKAQGFSTAPVIELVIPSTMDDSLAPRGAHVASLFCQHFRRNLPAATSWADSKQQAVDRVIDTLTDYAPNFRESIIAVQAFTPEDLEQRFGLVGGDIFHGVMSLDQLYWSRPAWGYAQYRSPVEGLYLCASGTHPGGGVSGAPGHNAAKVMIRDLRRGIR